MRAIVTGYTGFIGTALCRELIDNGHDVYAIVREGSDKRSKLENIAAGSQHPGRLEILEASLGELQTTLIDRSIEGDVFYHLAWNGSGGADREDYHIQTTNLYYVEDAIRAAAAIGCKSFVGAGSQAEYGVVENKAMENEVVPHPFMMYGAAKLAACEMGRILAGQLGIRFIWPRIYSVYGVGENPGTLVNYVIDSLREGRVPELSPCENMWNFLYISDCTAALRLLGESSETEGVYHIASKDTRVLRSFVEEIRDIVSPGNKLGFGARISDPDRTFILDPDISEISELGFVPKVSFSEGIKRKLEVMN